MPSNRSYPKRIVDMLLDFKGEKVREYCSEKIEKGENPYDILNELSIGLEEIGKGYEDKEFRRYFTSDLMVSGRNMKRAVEIVKPHIKERDVKSRGLVIIGTVKGDVHDIGKMIFAITLESNGFHVIDLGVDVSKESFIEKVKEVKPDILAMSSLLSSTVSSMNDVVAGLKEEQLRDKVKVIVGGRAVTEDFSNTMGVDAYGKDAIDGLKKCMRLLETSK